MKIKFNGMKISIEKDKLPKNMQRADVIWYRKIEREHFKGTIYSYALVFCLFLFFVWLAL